MSFDEYNFAYTNTTLHYRTHFQFGCLESFVYVMFICIPDWTVGITLFLYARGFGLIPTCVSVSGDASDPESSGGPTHPVCQPTCADCPLHDHCN
jgi:hypothetical protein